jgi:hypothetical protein
MLCLLPGDHGVLEAHFAQGCVGAQLWDRGRCQQQTSFWVCLADPAACRTSTEA